ncbi:MAG: transcriptional regulator NrdR [Kiritimatiellia bacterium]
MYCPRCGKNSDRVIDSRETVEGSVVRRRRECSTCGLRFTTYERIEHRLPRVVKRDGRREDFDREKIARGLCSACQKRSVKSEAIETLIDEVIAELERCNDTEVTTERIGTLIMERLRKLDNVAYVRFASVYWAFDDPRQFVAAVKELAGKMRRK